MAELAEEEEMSAQGPDRMRAVDDGLTTFGNQSHLRGMDMVGIEWSSANVPRVNDAIDLVVDNMMNK